MGQSPLSVRMMHTVGVFAALGPAIGILIVDGVFLLFAVGTSGTATIGAVDGAGIGQILGFLLLSIVIGYGVGIVPAVVTGLICTAWSPHLRSTVAWISACAVTGFIVTFLATSTVYGTSSVGILALAGSIGAAAGLG